MRTRAWNNPGRPDHGGGAGAGIMCGDEARRASRGMWGFGEKLPLFILRTMESLRNTLIGVITNGGKEGGGMARVLSWLKSRARVDEPVGQQERWWWPGMGGQEWGWGEMISRNILSVSPQEWQVDCGVLVREREVSNSPLAIVPIP